MSRLPKQLLVLTLLVVVAMSTTGCFLRSMLGHHFVTTLGEDIELNIAAFSANVTTGVCLQDDFHTGGLVQCTYYFASEELFPEVTSTAQLIADFGLFGVLVDPLILQVPADAGNFVATFYDGVSTRPLELTVADSFPVTPAVTVWAEPGQQFVILELPADVVASLPEGDPRLGPQFDFYLEFELADGDPLHVKGMYTGKVEGNGQTFYIPLLPCTTSFADLPALIVPQSDTPEPLLDQIIAYILQAGDPGCDGQVYDLRAPAASVYLPLTAKNHDREME